MMTNKEKEDEKRIYLRVMTEEAKIKSDGYDTWFRIDSPAPTYVLPPDGGPSWDDVYRRVTIDMGTGKIIADQLRDKLKDGGKGPLPSPVPRKIKTIFYFKASAGDARAVAAASDFSSPPFDPDVVHAKVRSQSAWTAPCFAEAGGGGGHHDRTPRQNSRLSFPASGTYRAEGRGRGQVTSRT